MCVCQTDYSFLDNMHGTAACPNSTWTFTRQIASSVVGLTWLSWGLPANFVLPVQFCFHHSLSQPGIWASFGHPNTEKQPCRTSKIFWKEFPKMPISSIYNKIFFTLVYSFHGIVYAHYALFQYKSKYMFMVVI